MKAIGVVFTALITLILLLAIIGVCLLWLGSSKSIGFPGLGIFVSLPLLLGILIAVEVILVLFAVRFYGVSLGEKRVLLQITADCLSAPRL